jgi:DNA-binding MurR/RpiR family transcriptional regulator
MIIFEKLKRLKKLTESEKEIVAYILNQPEEFISLSAKQIARNCYVSVPTIYRLCEKAGVSGLAEMKVQLSRNLSDYLAQNTAFDFDYPIKAKEAHDSIARNITEDYKETVKQTQALLDMSEMHKAVMALANARHISIYTSAGNVYMADNFRFQMQEIGIDVNVPTDEL